MQKQKVHFQVHLQPARLNLAKQMKFMKAEQWSY